MLYCLGLFLAACDGGEGSTPRLLFGDPRGIVEHKIDSGEETVLVAAASSTHTLRDPVVSPDGNKLAYSFAPPLARVDGVQDGGSDLWVAARDESESRALYTHARLTEAISSPRWLDDSTILAVARYLNDPKARDTGSTWILMRFDAETGAQTVLIPGVISFDISPDDTKVAYLLLESAAEQPLYIANIDGTQPTRQLDSTSGIESFASPRFSPDGKQIYFSGHEGHAVQALARLVTRAPIARSLVHSQLDLFVVDAAGGTARSVARLEVLEPGVALDPNGARIYVLAGGLFDVDPASGEITTLADGASYGTLFWIEDGNYPLDVGTDSRYSIPIR